MGGWNCEPGRNGGRLRVHQRYGIGRTVFVVVVGGGGGGGLYFC